MASLMIHIAIASEVNKVINRDPNSIMIGTIAPDIAKLINQTKDRSHFQTIKGVEIPNLEMFLLKYGNYLSDDFVMGYFIHLCADYIWNKYFLPSLSVTKGMITTLDGKTIKYSEQKYKELIYNDYTNLNIRLIDEYDLNLEMFYDPLPKFRPIIEEIPMDKLQIVVSKSADILANTKENKTYLFNIEDIKKYVKMTKEFVLSTLRDIYKD